MIKGILYIKPGCPWCEEALAFFTKHKLKLDIRDVLASKSNFQELVEISGQTKTPTFKYGSFVVADFSVEEFQEQLKIHSEISKTLGL